MCGEGLIPNAGSQPNTGLATFENLQKNEPTLHTVSTIKNFDF